MTENDEILRRMTGKIRKLLIEIMKNEELN